jgi:hypothetical protein
MKRLFLLAALWPLTSHAQDIDPRAFAINHCYVRLMNVQPRIADPWKDQRFWQCMGDQGFMFCQDCKVFVDGPACRDDKEHAPDRSNCWRHLP